MIKVLVIGILASVIVTISNLIIIRSNVDGLAGMLKIAIIVLPLQFAIGFLYTYYYSKGVHEGVSYPLLIVSSYGAGMVLSVLVQYAIMGKGIRSLDFIGIGLILFGVSFLLMNRNA